MSQHDYNLANAAGAAFRADANLVLQAIATNNSGSTEPSTTFAYQFWADTATSLLKQRNGANTDWIVLGKFTAAGFIPYHLGGPVAGTTTTFVDDFSDLQAAIDDLTAGGIVDARSVSGNQTLSSTITVDNPVTVLLGDVTITCTATTAFILGDDSVLRGNGWGRTTIKHGVSAAASSTPLVRNDDFTSGNSRIVLVDLTLDGNKTNQGAVTDVFGIQVQHCSDLYVHHVEVKDCVGIGLRGYHPKDRTYVRFNRISNCGADDTPRSGIYFTRTTTTGGETDTLVIEDNYVNGSGSNSGCVGVAATNSAVVRNVSIRRNTLVAGAPVGTTVNFGIEVFGQDSPEATLTDVSVEENKVSGDDAGASTYVFGISVAGRGIANGTVLGNSARDCGGRSIEVAAGNVDVGDNVEQNCGGIIYDLSSTGGSAKTFTGASLHDNVVESPTRTDGGIVAKNAATHTALGFRLTGNSVRTPAGNGIALLGDFQDGVLRENVVSDSSGAAAGSHAIAITPNTARPARLRIDENVVVDWTTGKGLRMNADDCFVGHNHYQNVTTETDFSSSTGIREPLRIEDVQDTSSGTAFDFTGIPPYAKRIRIAFDQVSIDGTNDLLVQIGDSGGIETSGYNSVSVLASAVVSSTGFIVDMNGPASTIIGHMTLEKVTGTTWVASLTYGDVGGFAQTGNGGGSKTLSGTLDRLRLTRTGSDNFDGGQVTISWE